MMHLSLDCLLPSCYITPHLRSFGACSRAIPECGARSGVLRRRLWNRSPREVRHPALRALRPGCEELAVTDPAQMPVREARDRSPKSPRWSAGRRASRVMGRKAPRQAPGLPRQVQAHGCLASTRTSLGAPPPLDRREAKRQSKTPAQKTRRGNEMGCLKSE